MDQTWNDLSQIETWRLAFPQVQIYLLSILRKRIFGKNALNSKFLVHQGPTGQPSFLFFLWGKLRSTRPPASLIFFLVNSFYSHGSWLGKNSPLYQRHFWVLIFWVGNSHKFKTTASKDFWFEHFGGKPLWIQSPSSPNGPNDFFGLNMSGNFNLNHPLPKKKTWIQVFGKNTSLFPRNSLKFEIIWSYPDFSSSVLNLFAFPRTVPYSGSTPLNSK